MKTKPGPPAVPIEFSAVTHSFGSLAIGSTSTFGVKVTNSNTAAFPFHLNSSGASSFTAATNCGTSIAAGANCEIVFTFAPTSSGSQSATWSLTAGNYIFTPSNGGTLSGSGTAITGSVTLTTAGHNFGTVAVGTQSPTYGTELMNSTASTITLTKGSVTAPFTALTNCGTTLASGANCELEFYFTPSATGTVQQVYSLSAAGVTITAGGQPLPNGGITLTGTGN
jgi:hypothetical protein